MPPHGVPCKPLLGAAAGVKTFKVLNDFDDPALLPRSVAGIALTDVSIGEEMIDVMKALIGIEQDSVLHLHSMLESS